MSEPRQREESGAITQRLWTIFCAQHTLVHPIRHRAAWNSRQMILNKPGTRGLGYMIGVPPGLKGKSGTAVGVHQWRQWPKKRLDKRRQTR